MKSSASVKTSHGRFQFGGTGLQGAAVVIVLMMAACPGSAYVTSKILTSSSQIAVQRWASFPITWVMNPTVGSNVTGSREQAAVLRQSFDSWAAVRTAAVSFAEGPPQDRKIGLDGYNVITSSLTASEFPAGAVGISLVFSYNSAGGVDPAGRPIQFPGQIVEVDIAFNPQISFTTNETRVSTRFDLQSVATHEIGHLLGLDHTNMLSAAMFPSIGMGTNYSKVLSSDDMLGVSSTYPSAAFAETGALTGTVRTTTNLPVYGAIVVAVNARGLPVASAITNPGGSYSISGLEPGAYTVYAEPMDAPFQVGHALTLMRIYPGLAVNSNFDTRYR